MGVWPYIFKKEEQQQRKCTDSEAEIFWADITGLLLKRSFTQQRTECCWQRANENKLIQRRLWLYAAPPALSLSLCARVCVCVCVHQCVCNSWHSPKLLLKTWWHRTGNWDIWILRRPFGLASHWLPPPSPPIQPPSAPPTCNSRLQPLEGIVRNTGLNQRGSQWCGVPVGKPCELMWNK